MCKEDRFQLSYYWKKIKAFRPTTIIACENIESLFVWFLDIYTLFRYFDIKATVNTLSETAGKDILLTTIIFG